MTTYLKISGNKLQTTRLAKHLQKEHPIVFKRIKLIKSKGGRKA